MKKVTERDVENFVVERFLATGDYQDVKQIATGLGVSETTIRARLQGDHSLVARQESRNSYSTDYRFMEYGAHLCWTYGPHIDTLRAMIVALRKERT